MHERVLDSGVKWPFQLSLHPQEEPEFQEWLFCCPPCRPPLSPGLLHLPDFLTLKDPQWQRAIPQAPRCSPKQGAVGCRGPRGKAAPRTHAAGGVHPAQTNSTVGDPRLAAALCGPLVPLFCPADGAHPAGVRGALWRGGRMVLRHTHISLALDLCNTATGYGKGN